MFAAKCVVPACLKTARWQIGFRVWPRNASPRTRATAVEGLTGFCVCDEHAIRNPDEFFTPTGKEKIERAFLSVGKGMPDFTTAEVIHAEVTEGAPITMEEAAQLGGFPDDPGVPDDRDGKSVY